MTTRRQLLVAIGAATLSPQVFPRQRAKTWRVAYLNDGNAEASVLQQQAFLQRLRELGYIQGANLAFEAQSAESRMERLPALGEALLAGKPDVVVASNSTPTRVLMKLTRTVPIVFARSADPVGTGLVRSLARPGGNVTGSSVVVVETAGKRIELLRELVPSARRFGFLGPFSNPGVGQVYAGLQAAARPLGVSVRALDAATSADIERAFASLDAEPIDALITAGSAVGHRKLIADLSLRRKLPALYVYREHLNSGGLMSFGPHITSAYRHAAEIVDRILRGANPADLPVEQQTQYLAINMKTAKALGINVPRSLMARADEVIQ